MESERELNPVEEDVRFVQTKLEETHFDLYRNVTKETLTEALHTATEVEPEYFKIALQEAIALIGDAHTYVPGILNGRPPLLACKEIQDDICIIGATEEQASLIGQKIQKINGYTVEEIMAKVSKLSSKENREVMLKEVPMFLTSPLVLRYYGFNKGNATEITTDTTKLNMVEQEGRQIKTKNPLKWRKGDLSDPTFVGNRDYRLRVVGNRLLFQYNSCTNQGHTKKELVDFQKQLLKIAKKSDAIVVDLRQNSGGNTGIMGDLFTKLPKDKKIYVAMGRETFSSAIHHLLYLKKEKNATLIGENAGQKPNRFGDNKLIKLPNSHIRVDCSYNYFELLPGENIDAIEPDIKIPVTIEDYMNKTDPLNKWIKDNL